MAWISLVIMNFLPNPLYHTRGSKPLFYPEIIDILWDSSVLLPIFSQSLKQKRLLYTGNPASAFATVPVAVCAGGSATNISGVQTFLFLLRLTTPLLPL